jgi:hypothetical protein
LTWTATMSSDTASIARAHMSAPTLLSRERVLSSHNVGLSNSFARCHRLMSFEVTPRLTCRARGRGCKDRRRTAHTGSRWCTDRIQMGICLDAALIAQQQCILVQPRPRHGSGSAWTLLSRVTRRILAQPAPDVISTMSRGSPPPPPSVPSWQSDKHGLARPPLHP